MACSCKTKHKEVSISVPTSTVSKQVNIRNFIAKENKQSILQIVSDSISQSSTVDLSKYNFSSTTHPTELCYNCIRKHLSIAYTLLQQDNPQFFLLALGQILCAALHLTGKNKDLRNLMQNRVLRAMRGDKHLLLEDVLNWLQNIQNNVQLQQQIIPQPEEACLIGLMRAYSLLFIQVTYQQLNKNWASAQLLKGAIDKFGKDFDLSSFQNVRKIWKLIQSMENYDQTYRDAKKLLQQELKTQWQQYKTMNIIV